MIGFWGGGLFGGVGAPRILHEEEEGMHTRTRTYMCI